VKHDAVTLQGQRRPTYAGPTKLYSRTSSSTPEYHVLWRSAITRPPVFPGGQNTGGTEKSSLRGDALLARDGRQRIGRAARSDPWRDLLVVAPKRRRQVPSPRRAKGIDRDACRAVGLVSRAPPIPQRFCHDLHSRLPSPHVRPAHRQPPEPSSGLEAPALRASASSSERWVIPRICSVIWARRLSSHGQHQIRAGVTAALTQRPS
jgi:hypothetical protein